MKRTVGCVIPAYNAELFLAEAVESVLRQSYSVSHIVVVDDGSSDGTAQIAQSFGSKVHFVAQPNKGPAAARNRGVRESQGEFLAFLDADDKWDEQKIELQMAALEARPDCGYCVTYIQNFWIDELEEERRRFAQSSLAQPMPGYLTQTLLVRRSVFDQVGPLHETAGAGDATDWFLRARGLGIPSLLLPQTLVYRRMHHNNRSRGLGNLPREVLLDFCRSALQRKKQGK